METIGQRVRFLRNSKKLSMEELGKEIDSNSATISNIENDKSIPGGKILIGLSDFFGVSTDWILKGENAIKTEEDSQIFFSEKWEKNYQSGQNKVGREVVRSLLELVSELDDSDVEILTILATRLKGSSFSEHFEEPILSKPTKKRLPSMDKGLVIREKNLPNHYFVSIPLIGQVSAGLPVTAFENVEDILEIPADYLPGTGTFFALRVKGDSMVNVGIHDGELVIVRQESTAENGDIVVAMINDEDATVKTFYKENGHIRLQPENDCMEPIIVPDVRILGKVVSVYKYAGKR